jgi:hypothetical protein
MSKVHNAWNVRRVDLHDTNKGNVTSHCATALIAIADNTNAVTEGGSNVINSLRKAVKLIEKAESITQE